ncbi:hypothetical protein V6N12_059099 [Hibiscus sabdariffa]|uniref:RNase H type-1 domain-containing protein n=1 Tax=Hibiscus sabdariffa TaxID=183260 RepID=A0ABR2EU24_9ROSI
MVEVDDGSVTTLQAAGNHIPARSTREVSWSKPPLGWVKLNSDGAVNMIMGLASCGGVIKDDKGRLLGSLEFNHEVFYAGSCSTLLPYIMEMIARAWNVQLNHVVREGNVLADMIAKLDLNEDFIVHWLFLSPASSVRLISTEAVVRDLLDTG